MSKVSQFKICVMKGAGIYLNWERTQPKIRKSLVQILVPPWRSCETGGLDMTIVVANGKR